MSRLRLSIRQQPQRTMGRRRSATFAAVAVLVICPLGVAACGGTNVSETTPKNTPEITAPTESASDAVTTKTQSHSGSATASEAETGTEEGTTEPEASETGGVEATEEPEATGGEVAPAEETEPTEEEPAGSTGGASAP